jgi:hypothetical protein
MDFSDALRKLKSGACIKNMNWNGPGMYLALQVPDQFSKMGTPYIYLCMPDSHPNYPHVMVPWTPSQLDLMSDGWEICGPKVPL